MKKHGPEYSVDELMSEFLAVASHELRTPLSIARWHTELILDGFHGQVRDTGMQSSLRAVEKGLHRMNTSLNSMLRTLEIMRGGKHVRHTKIHIEKLLEESLREIQAEERGSMKVIFDERCKNLQIEADKEMLFHIATALASNAFAYGNREATCSVSLTNETMGSMLSFEVEDNGIGVPLLERDLIFTKFYRGHEARKIKPDGLGLSLFIARAFAEMHGGSLDADQRKDGAPGARFICRLPILRSR